MTSTPTDKFAALATHLDGPFPEAYSQVTAIESEIAKGGITPERKITIMTSLEALIPALEQARAAAATSLKESRIQTYTYKHCLRLADHMGNYIGLVMRDGQGMTVPPEEPATPPSPLSSRDRAVVRTINTYIQDVSRVWEDSMKLKHRVADWTEEIEIFIDEYFRPRYTKIAGFCQEPVESTEG